MRYEKYKDSGIEWIGEIPEHWEVKRIRHLAEIFGRIGYRGYKVTDLVHKGEGAITISPSNMKEFNMDFDSCTYLSWDKYEESPEIMIYNGDILFVKTGSTYGKSSFVQDLPEKATINPQIVVLKNIKSNNKLLWYIIKSNIVQFQVEQTVVGGTIPTISQARINNYLFPIPNSLEEQTAIANYLDRKTAQIDELIADKKRLLELYEEEKTAIINQAVTGKDKACLVSSDVKMKDSGIDWLGEIPEHWEVKKLKYLTKGVITGKTPPSSNLSYYNGDIDWFAPVDFNNRLVLKNSKRKITEQAITEAGMKIYPPNSVLLVGIGATLGKLGITINSSTSNQQINAIIFDEKKINPFYGLYFLLSFKNAIIRLANSATLAIFNQTQTKEFEVFVPPLKEQTAIVQYIETELNRINAKVEKTKKLIDLLGEYKQSLISEVVTGKIKVI